MSPGKLGVWCIRSDWKNVVTAAQVSYNCTNVQDALQGALDVSRLWRAGEQGNVSELVVVSRGRTWHCATARQAYDQDADESRPSLALRHALLTEKSIMLDANVSARLELVIRGSSRN